MPISTPGDVSPAYDQLAGALRDADALVGAAQCHGMLCGMLCGANDVVEALWEEYVLGDVPAGAGTLAECGALMRRLLVATQESLISPDMDFAILLPDDEHALAERVEALREWCEGFLFGFGSMAGNDFSAQPEATREFITDLREFSRLDDEPEITGEENEAAFTEVVEYLRAGVLTARTERLTLEDADRKRVH
ncbi:MAG: UPF0149 family protein [Gammaproteobacteria bacterium]|nr:UPF0149 family protein [Gammaproteobacteria bacterium]